MGTPLLSIIIPLSDSVPQELHRNLSTVAANLTPACEVLGLAWGCPPETQEAFRRSFQDFPHIRLETAPRETTAGALFNLGIRQAQGRYLMFMEPENEMTPTTVERIQALLNEKPTLDLMIMTAVIGRMDDEMYFVPEDTIRSFPGLNEGSGMRLLEKLGELGTPLRCESFLGCYRRDFLLQHQLLADEATLDQVDLTWTPRVYLAARHCSTMQRLLPSFWCVRKPHAWRERHQSMALEALPHAILSLVRFYQEHHREMPALARKAWAITTLAPIVGKVFRQHPEERKISDADQRKILETLWNTPDTRETLLQMERFLPASQRTFCRLLRLFTRTGVAWPAKFWQGKILG
ncbi:MAG: glycosyltransferase [Oligosphaeraceae bacterium]